jgi:hypothetical protein
MMAMAPTMAKPILSHLRAALLALVTTLVAFAATAAMARDRVVDLEPFYEQLAPYGQWFEHPVWGTVWRPRVDQDWRPYARGMWVYTDEFGWYWEAEEPWGWAAFHYGRWLIAEDGAWIWLPDNEWGPAWVAWRASDEYVGWAPLPPDAHWGADGELLFDAAFYSEPRYHSVWCFVRPHQLVLTGLHRYLVSARHANAVFSSSRPFRAHHRFDGRFVNAGYDVRRFERMTGRPVVRMRLKTVDSPQASRLGRGHAYGAEISVYKPSFVEQPQGRVRLQRPAAVGAGRSNGPERPQGRDLGRESAEGSRPAGQNEPLRTQTPEPSRAPALARPAGPSSGGASSGGASSGGASSGGPSLPAAAGVDPSPPAARPPATEPPRRPGLGAGDGANRNRQPWPSPAAAQAGTHGGGPPPGLNQRPYGGPAPSTQPGGGPHGMPQGTPRVSTSPTPTARPFPPTTTGPTSLRAPPAAQGPALRAPAPGPQRRAPRKEDNNKEPR